MGKKGKKLNITSLNQSKWQSSIKHLNVTFGHHLIAVSLISFLCLIVYTSTLDFPFVFDDFPNIVQNPRIRLTRLDIQSLYDAGFNAISSNRPLAGISFAVNYYFGRYDPAGYHIVNIVIHLINGILVYFLALSLFNHNRPAPSQPSGQSPGFQTFLMALFSSLFFVVHPLQTQSVTYIVQRMNSMSAMFFLLSLFFYIRARFSGTVWVKWILFLSGFASWIMALASKEIAIMSPIIILLYEWYFFQDLSTAWLRKSMPYILIFTATACLFIFIRSGGTIFDTILASYNVHDFSMGERVLTQFRVIVFYISLILYPHPSRLNLEHSITTSRSLIDPVTTLLSLFFILFLIGLAVYLAPRNRLVSFGILWFFINLVVESSVIGLAMIFEHRLYLPMLGPALITSWLIFHFLSNKRFWAVAVSAVIILMLSMGANLRNKAWQDHTTLWSDVLSKNPSHRAHNNLGLSLAAQKKFHEAIEHYHKALLIKPIYRESYSYAQCHTNLGLALASLGNLDKAVLHYEEALRIYPNLPEAHNNLGLLLAQQRKIKKAIDHYSKALQINPSHINAHNNLGAAFLRQRKINEAILQFNEAIRINPENVSALNNLGIAFASKKKYNEAIQYFSEALRINPGDASAHCNLGMALLSQNSKTHAIEHLSEALRIRPGFRVAEEGLRKALETQGQ